MLLNVFGNTFKGINEMKDTALNLPMAAELQVLFEKQSFRAELIGYAADQSVIITLPMELARADNFDEGAVVIVKHRAEELVVAFPSRVLCIAERPYPHLHLAYPAGVQGLMRRRSPRTEVTTPQLKLVLQDDIEQTRITMADVSLFGACLLADKRLGNVDESLDIEMSLRHSGEEIRLPCRIRYVQEKSRGPKNERFQHGVAFTGLEPAAERFIHSLIAENLRKPNHQRPQLTLVK